MGSGDWRNGKAEYTVMRKGLRLGGVVMTTDKPEDAAATRLLLVYTTESNSTRQMAGCDVAVNGTGREAVCLRPGKEVAPGRPTAADRRALRCLSDRPATTETGMRDPFTTDWSYETGQTIQKIMHDEIMKPLIEGGRLDVSPRSSDTSETQDGLPADLRRFWNSYVEMFGDMPPLPKKRFECLADNAPERLRQGEKRRADAYDNEVFDLEATQLLILAMLVAVGSGAAKWHAIASRRAGATAEKIREVIELAATGASLGRLNEGRAMLYGLRDHPDFQ